MRSVARFGLVCKAFGPRARRLACLCGHACGAVLHGTIVMPRRRLEDVEAIDPRLAHSLVECLAVAYEA